MTRDEFINIVYSELHSDGDNYRANRIIDAADDYTDEIVEALKQQPCEDCISREAVDEYITNLLSGYLYDEERTRLEDLTAYIWELPSVQSTRPTARWEKYVDGYKKCSRCGKLTKYYRNHKYCPDCGARMMESEE